MRVDSRFVIPTGNAVALGVIDIALALIDNAVADVDAPVVVIMGDNFLSGCLFRVWKKDTMARTSKSSTFPHSFFESSSSLLLLVGGAEAARDIFLSISMLGLDQRCHFCGAAERCF